MQKLWSLLIKYANLWLVPVPVATAQVKKRRFWISDGYRTWTFHCFNKLWQCAQSVILVSETDQTVIWVKTSSHWSGQETFGRHPSLKNVFAKAPCATFKCHSTVNFVKVVNFLSTWLKLPFPLKAYQRFPQAGWDKTAHVWQRLELLRSLFDCNKSKQNHNINSKAPLLNDWTEKLLIYRNVSFPAYFNVGQNVSTSELCLSMKIYLTFHFHNIVFAGASKTFGGTLKLRVAHNFRERHTRVRRSPRVRRVPSAPRPHSYFPPKLEKNSLSMVSLY